MSADVGLGLPYNIASYATLLHMLAHISGQKPGTLVWNGGDVHVYKNHTDGLQYQLTCTIQNLPELRIIDRGQQTLRDFSIADFELSGYHPHKPIKLEVAV